MVGIAGFEPTSDGVKVRCLTAWLYPRIFKKAQVIAHAFLYVGWVVGIEPTIFGTTIRRFNQLSHTHHVWHATEDSNL